MPHRTAGCGKSSLRPLMAGSSPSLPDGSNPSAAIVQSASDVQCSRLLKTTYEIGNGSGARIMSITTPRAGLGHQSDRGIVGAVDSIWYTSLSTLDIVRGDVEVVGASVHVVPTIGVGSLLASGLLVFGVRRRRADRAL